MSLPDFLSADEVGKVVVFQNNIDFQGDREIFNDEGNGKIETQTDQKTNQELE